MSNPKIFDNLVIVSVKRAVPEPLRARAGAAAGALLTMAGIAAAYVAAKAEEEDLSSQDACDKQWLSALLNMPHVEPAGQWEKPETKELRAGVIVADLIELLLGAGSKRLADPAALKKVLVPRAKRVITDALRDGAGGVSALRLDVAPAGHGDADDLRATLRWVAYTGSDLEAVSEWFSLGTDPAYNGTVRQETNDVLFHHERILREPGRAEWDGFLKDVPKIDVTRLGNFVEVRLTGPWS